MVEVISWRLLTLSIVGGAVKGDTMHEHARKGKHQRGEFPELAVEEREVVEVAPMVNEVEEVMVVVVEEA